MREKLQDPGASVHKTFLSKEAGKISAEVHTWTDDNKENNELDLDHLPQVVLFPKTIQSSPQHIYCIDWACISSYFETEKQAWAMWYSLHFKLVEIRSTCTN